MAEKDARQGGAVLRNEFFELVIDPHLGSIRAIYDLHSRGPRLAQQLAMRLSGGDDDDAYTIMAADEIRVTESGPILSEAAVRGRLVDRAGQVAAEFTQTTRVTWGSRVIEIEVELDPRRELGSDPWNSYFAARFAWAQDQPKLYRAVNQATVASEAMRLESSQFVEIRGGSKRTTILTRRTAVSSPLRPAAARYSLARPRRNHAAVPLRHWHRPSRAAGGRFGLCRAGGSVPVDSLPKNDSGWLFHLDNRTVVATHWEPIVASGAVSGVRVRLLEPKAGTSRSASARSAP